MKARKSCPVEGCGIEIPRHLLMCRWHWGRVPRVLQRPVNANWNLFRSSSDRDERFAALRAYRTARDDAIAAAAGVLRASTGSA